MKGGAMASLHFPPLLFPLPPARLRGWKKSTYPERSRRKSAARRSLLFFLFFSSFPSPCIVAAM